MILAIDAGNTNIIIGVFSGEKLIFKSRIATHFSNTDDEYAAIFSDLIALYNVDSEKIRGAIISCVVPPIKRQLTSAVKKFCNCSPYLVGPGIKTGLNIKIDNPSSLGSDLVSAAVAAKSLCPLPCIMIDFSTATKIFALDKMGNFIGGVIAPGVNISLEALSDKTAALPMVSLEPMEKVIGTNTVDSMKSGVLNGIACMVDGLVARIENEMGEKSSVIATGDYAKIIKSHSIWDFIIDDDLILKGLFNIYNQQGN